MENPDQFIKIIEKFIDSITATNQGLGSINNSINTLISKIEELRSNAPLTNDIHAIRDDLDEIVKWFKTENAMFEEIKKIAEFVVSVKDDKLEEKKLNHALKVEKVKIEATTKLEVWKITTGVILALITGMFSLYQFVIKEKLSEKDKDQPKVEKKVKEKESVK